MLFGPKGLHAEVTEGVDLENGITLTGHEVTVGSGPGDDLQLGARDVVPGHLTLQRRQDGKGWDYFTSDRGMTTVSKGNPRAGTLRAGMWIRLGAETKISFQRVAVEAEDISSADGEEKKTIPLTTALPALGILVVGLAFILGSGGGDGGSGLRTTPWFEGSASLTDAITTCTANQQIIPENLSATDPAAAFWRYVRSENSDVVALESVAKDLQLILAQAHFLRREKRFAEAADAIRRLKYVLPVEADTCPILSASHYDLAVFEVSSN